jgi:hypothetical protein
LGLYIGLQASRKLQFLHKHQIVQLAELVIQRSKRGASVLNMGAASLMWIYCGITILLEAPFLIKYGSDEVQTDVPFGGILKMRSVAFL